MRKYIHKLIKWYLLKCCGGAFHTGKYNSNEGYYVGIYTDKEYGRLQQLQIKENRYKL